MGQTEDAGRRSNARFALRALTVCLAVGLGAGVRASVVTFDASPSSDASALALGSLANWSDTDKLNLGAAVYFDDANVNGVHDPGEAFAATDPGGWASATDLSCWLASGANMLAQAGANYGDAQGIYDDYALNGIDVGGTIYTWDDGGLQEFVINQWIADRPGEAGTLSLSTYWRSTSVMYVDGMFAWEDLDVRQAAADALDAGDEVGIGMWPLYYDGEEGSHEGGHALTVQDVSAALAQLTVTDSDRDNDWSASGDLNTYADATRGPTAFLGHDYYAWYNDFYDGDILHYRVGDVGYVAILSGHAIVPAPASLLVGMIAAAFVALARRTRAS